MSGLAGAIWLGPRIGRFVRDETTGKMIDNKERGHSVVLTTVNHTHSTHASIYIYICTSSQLHTIRSYAISRRYASALTRARQLNYVFNTRI